MRMTAAPAIGLAELIDDRAAERRVGGERRGPCHGGDEHQRDERGGRPQPAAERRDTFMALLPASHAPKKWTPPVARFPDSRRRIALRPPSQAREAQWRTWVLDRKRGPGAEDVRSVAAYSGGTVWELHHFA